MKLFMLSGPPGCGKTHYANLLKTQTDAQIFSISELKESFYHSQITWSSDLNVFEYCDLHKKQFQHYLQVKWNSALHAGSIIFDDCNLTRKSRAAWIKDAKANNFEIIGIEILTPLAECIDRQKLYYNEKKHPYDITQAFYKQQSFLLGREIDKLIIVDGTRPLSC